MESTQVAVMLLSAAILLLVGCLALVRPAIIRDAALRNTGGIRRVPLVPRIAVDWVESRWYLGTTRLLGVVAIAMAVVLLVALLADR